VAAVAAGWSGQDVSLGWNQGVGIYSPTHASFDYCTNVGPDPGDSTPQRLLTIAAAPWCPFTIDCSEGSCWTLQAAFIYLLLLALYDRLLLLVVQLCPTCLLVFVSWCRALTMKLGTGLEPAGLMLQSKRQCAPAGSRRGQGFKDSHGAGAVRALGGLGIRRRPMDMWPRWEAYVLIA